MQIKKDHAKQKILISGGIITSSTLSVAAPHLTTSAVIIGIFANMIWLWL
jgi:hypothetical protein